MRESIREGWRQRSREIKRSTEMRSQEREGGKEKEIRSKGKGKR